MMSSKIRVGIKDGGDFYKVGFDALTGLNSMKPETFLSIVLRKSLIDFLCSGEFMNSYPLILSFEVLPNRLLFTESNILRAAGETLLVNKFSTYRG